MNSNQGFTLIEVLMVIALIAVLAAIGVPNYINYGNDAKTSVTNDRMNQLKLAIVGDSRVVSAGSFSKQGFIAHCQVVPSALADLVVMPGSGVCAAVYNPFNQTGWRGPYVSTTDPHWNQDAWGTAYVYDSAGRTITSCGPDLTCGNGDDIVLSF